MRLVVYESNVSSLLQSFTCTVALIPLPINFAKIKEA